MIRSSIFVRLGLMNIALLTFRDPATAEHSWRVWHYMKIFAGYVRYPRRKRSRLRTMCLMHDIGKIGIPDDVLMYKGKFADEHREIMKHHVNFSRSILLILGMEEVAEWVYLHHERWDGKGYPIGLVGNSIPYESRMLAIVDTYEALTGSRKYHKRKTKKEALQEIRNNEGTQFDKELAEKFIRMMNKVKGG